MDVGALNLSAFRSISNGAHNMGDVRIGTDGKLEAVNRFVGRQFNNQSYVSVSDNIAVRNAFVKSLSTDQRVTAEMLASYKAILLGNNAVKTLTRDEIAACFKALDRRDISNLTQTISDLERRDLLADNRLVSVTSSRTVAFQLSVNERLDTARCYSQFAANECARMVLASGPDHAGAAKNAFASFKENLAQMLANAVSDDVSSMRKKVDDALANFDPCGNPKDFPERLKSSLNALMEFAGGTVEGAVKDLLDTASLGSPSSLSPSLVEMLRPEIARAEGNGVEIPQMLRNIAELPQVDIQKVEASAPNAVPPIELPELDGLNELSFVRELCEDYRIRQPSVDQEECCTSIEWGDRILATLERTANAHPEAKPELDRLKLDVMSRRNAEIHHRDNNPLSYNTVLKRFSMIVNAAEDVYRGLVGDGGVRQDCLNELRLDMDFLDGVTDYNADYPGSGSVVGDAVKKLSARLKTVFAAHGMVVHHVKRQLKEALALRLCKEPWKPLVNEFWAVLPSKGNGADRESVQVKNDIKTFRDIPGFTDNVEYEDGMNGIACHMVKSWHATTPMNSQFCLGDKVIFNGIRTGIPCPSGVDVKDLEKATKNRVKETIIASILANETVMKELRADSNATPSMLFSSTALLSPDLFRGAMLSIDSDKNEKLMLKYQWQAMNDFNGTEVEVKVDGLMRKVKLDIPSFNFGVNQYAVGWRSSVTGGWGGEIDLKTGPEKVRDHNRASLKMLRKHVQDGLGKIAKEIDRVVHSGESDMTRVLELQKKSRKITLLMKQVQSVIDSEDEGSGPQDTYKVGARINMITYLLGGTPQWNCKSGKDRTGQLDVETKFLALLLETDRRIPEPGEKLSEEYRELLGTVTFGSDNQMVQIYSSGLPGFKVDASTVEQRLPDDENVMRRYAAFNDQIK